jgi:hypothetical protein
LKTRTDSSRNARLRGIFLTIPLSVLPGSARLPMGGRFT